MILSCNYPGILFSRGSLWLGLEGKLAGLGSCNLASLIVISFETFEPF